MLAYLTQLSEHPPNPRDLHIMKWPGDNRIWWFDALMGQYVPGPPSMFEGGDAWELEGLDADEDRPLPWRL